MSAQTLSWEQAADLHEVACSLLGQGRLSEAEALTRAALHGLRAAVGPLHPDTGNAAATLAEIAALHGRFDEALSLLEETAESCAPWRGEPAADPIRWRGELARAEVLIRLARYGEAGQRVEALLAEAPERSVQIAAMALAGVLDRFEGRWEAAERRYRMALDGLPEGDPGRADLLHNLAGLASARGDFGAAEGWAREALALRPDPGARAAALDRAGLGDALAGQGRHAEAAALYRQTINQLQAERDDDPEIAYALHNLGDALASLGQREAAQGAYAEALDRKTALFGASHPEIAATLGGWAALLVEAGKGRRAEALLRRAEGMVRDLLPDHPVRRGVEALLAQVGPS